MTDALRRLPRPVLLTLAGLLVVAAAFVLLRPGGGTRTVTAHFSRAVSIFPDSEVRILGVPVGRVTAVVPEGDTVRVDMEYDDSYSVPRNAQAVIITPTLTADRFVQLTPAYTGGPKLADGADIAVQDTGTPIELDRIYRSLADITRALGPNGVNRDGTLNHTLSAGAKFLHGEGARANTTIVNLSKAVETFGNGSGELFGTVRALDEFSGALAANDQAVSRFMDDLGGVSQQLAGEKDELSAALRVLAGVLGKVERFVKDNRADLVHNVENVTRIVKVIAGEKAALEDILDIGPSAMNNLAIAFDPKSESIGSRLNFQGNTQDLDNLLCALVRNDQMPRADDACALFKRLLTPFEEQLRNGNNASTGLGGSSGGTRQTGYGSAPAARDLHQLLGGSA